MESMKHPVVETGVANVSMLGQAESGDKHLIKCFPEGVLLAVVDGLGHGTEAAKTALIATATLGERPRDSVTSLVRRCHEKLRNTRGAVMSVVSINTRDKTLSWLGVGNVETVLIKASANHRRPYEAPVIRGGVVGDQLPPLLAAVTLIAPGDVLILATDGIRGGFEQDISRLARPQRIASHILEHYGKGTDDALVLVARYLGK